MRSVSRQGYLKGAAILSAAVIATKAIGFFYKVPLQNLIGDENTGIFTAAYNVYSVLLAVATAGIPVALSRLVASAAEQERPVQVRRYFLVAMPVFTFLGGLGAALMYLFSRQIAGFVGVPEAAAGIRVLAPAVLLVCVYSVYRGYLQGFGNMIPTALSQIVESVGKVAVGLTAAWLLLDRGAPGERVCAGALAGTTAGIALTIPLMARYKRRTDAVAPLFRNTVDEPAGIRETVRRLLHTSFPVALGASAMSVFALVDTKLIYARLQQRPGISYDRAKALFGVYAKAQTLFNLPSALFIVPVTVAIVPAIAAAAARRDRRQAGALMTSALRLNNLLAMPVAFGMSVTAYTLYGLLYGQSSAEGPVILSILAVASYFVCLQLVTTSILQAWGLERAALVTVPLGGLVKVAASWHLVGRIGILGAPVGTLLCYGVIAGANLLLIRRRLPGSVDLLGVTLRPGLCTFVMTGAAWGINGLLPRLLPGLRASRWGLLLALGITVWVSAAVYGICVFAFGAVKKQDLKYLPNGKKMKKWLN